MPDRYIGPKNFDELLFLPEAKILFEAPTASNLSELSQLAGQKFLQQIENNTHQTTTEPGYVLTAITHETGENYIGFFLYHRQSSVFPVICIRLLTSRAKKDMPAAPVVRVAILNDDKQFEGIEAGEKAISQGFILPQLVYGSAAKKLVRAMTAYKEIQKHGIQINPEQIVVRPDVRSLGQALIKYVPQTAQRLGNIGKLDIQKARNHNIKKRKE